jgi:uncharacterized membrane protein
VPSQEEWVEVGATFAKASVLAATHDDISSVIRNVEATGDTPNGASPLSTKRPDVADGNSNDHASTILRHRYASGALDRQAFLQIRSDLAELVSRHLNDQAWEILRTRYATGDITRVEFLQIRDDLLI